MIPAMSDLIRIVEGRRAKLPRANPIAPVDAAALEAAIGAVIATLKQSPFHLEFDPVLANALLAQAREIIAQYDEPGEVPPTKQEALLDAFERMWQRRVFWFPSFHMRRDLSDASQDYQLRAAERHGRSDDPNFYIEDSDWLRGMQAQESLCDEMNRCDFRSPQESLAAINAIKAFITTYKEATLVRDEGEEPFLLDGVRDGLGELLPLLALLYSVQKQP